jgi:hypothetical protein
VLVVNAEDDVWEMRRRLVTALKPEGINQAELAGRISLADNPAEVVVAKFDAKTKTLTRTPLLERLIATITALQIDVVAVDPFAETFEGDENSNSELKWAAMLWREIARRTNVAVLLVHHTRKYSSNMAGDADAARGASALIGVARVVATVFSMTDAEGKAMEIDEADRPKYIRFDDAKSNLSLISGQARWFEKKTYTLTNATPDRPGDDVGALVPWFPPGPLDGVDAETTTRILDRIDLGCVDKEGKPTGVPYTANNNAKKDGTASPRWAGIIVNGILACDYERAAKILKLWKTNGTLIEFDAMIRGKKRKGVRSSRPSAPKFEPTNAPDPDDPQEGLQL